MIPERTAYEDELEVLKVFGGLFLIFFVWLIWTLPAPAAPAPVINITPAPTLTYAPTPPPTPAPVITMKIDQLMIETGGLPMGEWLSWSRSNATNAMGKGQDMSTHTTVYGYKMLGTVDWYSVSWGQYFKMGAGDGQKFVFIFINSYSDQDMARMWGIQESQFALQVEQEVYLPSQILKPEIRIKQFDEVWNFQHVENVKPYGYIRYYDSNGREAVMQQGYLKAGYSNAWDGYIVFVVPKNAQAKDMKVLAQFGNLMEPHWWQLK